MIEHNDLPSPEALINMMGLSGRCSGNELRIIDPRDDCNDTKGKMYINLETGLCMCHKCGWRGNLVKLYQELNNISSYAEAVREIKEGCGEITFKPKKKPVKKIMADIDTRDKVYRKLLGSLVLTKEDGQNLLNRGFRHIPEFYKSTYRTFDIISRFALSEIKGVPGFYRKGESPRISKVKEGFFVPYLDIEGRIQGLQIRTNDADSKYIWFSSGYACKDDKEYGTPAGTFVHFAVDRYHGDPLFPVQNRNGEVVCGLTEGALKADLFHQISRMPCIAIPGVNSTKELSAALLLLKQYGVTAIYNYFDMDYITNLNVQSASRKLEALILNNGFKYYRPIWNPRYKGIDDYVAFTAKH